MSFVGFYLFCFWLLSLETQKLWKNNSLTVTRMGIKWAWISLQSSIPREMKKFGSSRQRSHSQSLSLFDLTLSLFNEKSHLRVFVRKKKKKSSSNCLTLQVPHAVMPTGQNTKKLEEWDAHKEFWIVHIQYGKSRRPCTCTELCICSRKTWAGPNGSPLADLKALHK